ncbi:ribosomal oxygenase [Gallibacterium salpingitidis]|uniref:Ribosomal oxygenase n=1 Tax=Gallibacterium salpingitidis TaxID=505341 RepID=A0AB36E5P4_9PAST|nr:cupin domain-containing protein [Gallibacterium salpingitidis]OBX08481.1 ribosomal oxygenase [Gallibacterium salpingitidis]OBX11664.1 ribosomal oxygenase [Gallibacterium salpingitidis]
MNTIPFCLPKQITPEIFLRDYWQKQPLLIRQGLPQIVGMFEPQDIIELAQEEEVTARLIQTHQHNGEEKWQLKTSPLKAKDFKNLPEKWSVLVQNLEQWSPELGKLWQAFAFIPQWQRDDIMVSFAPKGGSVGKHYDEYDVFLVQGYGQRRWQLGKWCDPSTEFKANQPIRIFDEMGELILDEVMQPGDVLYVPSRLSHYGVAESDCLTFSFGLRYPNASDILENFCKALEHHNEQLNSSDFAIPFRLAPNLQNNGLLSPENIATLKQQLISLLQNSSQFDDLFSQAVATTVSTRRYNLLATEDEYYPKELQEALQQGDVIIQDANSKIIYTDNGNIFINGEWIDELNDTECQLLAYLADGNALDWQTLQQYVSQDIPLNLLLDSLCDWLDNGWLLLDTE